jgi:thiol-disulfide isomerase/thioredoxin
LTPQLLAATPDALLSHTLAATNADAAWPELADAMHSQPPLPATWQTTPPSETERGKYFLPYVFALQDKAKDFYTKFPKDSHVFDARRAELELAFISIRFGATDLQSHVDSLEAAAEKDYPDRPELMQLLMQIAGDSEPSKARLLYKKVVASSAPDALKAEASSEIQKLDAIGKPVDLQFTAVDGRQVDVSKLKGKVVMLDFWATWCGPCVGEVPNVKAAYDELHSQGFEIVGISLDKEKDRLTKFVADHNMAWPQYFDGQYWQNKYAEKFGIHGVPSMWLIDKKGNLRDLNGRDDLSGKVKKLLAEQD